MKKLNSLTYMFAILPFIALIIFFSACTKEGPMGPAGKDGANGKDGLNGMDATAACKTCHTATNWAKVEYQLEMSRHGDKEGNMASEGQQKSCAKCHSRQGFHETLQNGLDTPTVNMGSASPYAGDFTLDCQVCHDFHGTLDEKDFPNYALRNVPGFKAIFLKSINIDKGGSNACISCHQFRPNTSVQIGTKAVGLDTIPDATTGVKITSSRYGGHHGPQGNLFAGVGAGAYEIPGPSVYSNFSSHKTLICGDCHILSTADSVNQTGGHYFKLAKRDAKNATVAGSENVSKCVSCHPGKTNHNMNNLQSDIKALMLSIETKLITMGAMKNNGGPNGYGGVNTDGYILGDNGTANATASNPRTVTAKQAKAIFNFKCVYEDYSYGVHNPDYIKALLTNANAAL